MSKNYWQKCNWNYLSDKARRFFEESDASVLDALFGKCNSIEEIEKIANDLYDEIFG